jgi:PAS domain S-box-containing protein
MSPPNLTTFDHFFGMSPLGCALSDMSGRFLRVNQAFADLVGHSMTDILRLSHGHITPKQFANEDSIQLQRLSEQGAFGPYEKEFLHRDGFLVPVRLSGWLVESDGQNFILAVAQALHARPQAARQARVGRATIERSGDPEWSEAKNARRCELIDRKIQNTISTEEAAELKDLQEALRAYLDRVAPLPMEGAIKLHAELMRREEKGGTQNAGL